MLDFSKYDYSHRYQLYTVFSAVARQIKGIYGRALNRLKATYTSHDGDYGTYMVVSV